jgi:hypothetical protein
MASTPQSMLQIISSGLEDISRLNPIKGQPSPTFYKTVINRSTRWASQWRRVEFDNKADFGRAATVTLPILGELISRAVLVVVLPDIVGPQEAALQAAKANFGDSADSVVAGLQSSVYPAWSWTNSIGHALCSNISMSLSNSPIDSFDSRLLEVIDEFHAPFDHFDTTNFLIGRDPSSFNPLAYNSRAKILGQTKTVFQSPQTVQVVPPFWWNRGPGPQALPIQALAKDKVQLTCTFRAAQDVIYTDARVPGTPVTGRSNIPAVASAPFYYPDSAGPVTLSQYGRDPVTGLALPDVTASLVPATMPTELHFTDAYWIVEYISLEDREAAAFRLGDLTYPIETHVALPVAPTNGAARTRIEIEQGGLVRDLTWVAQRVEATDYNAYFLFSRDLAPQGARPSETPWWPNAVFPTWDFGDGYITTGFSSTRSDPLLSAMLTLGSKTRFEFSGPSLFRSLLPALNCKKAPLVNRYIYRYDFGLWPTGGLAEASDRPRDEIRGSANWDRIPTKELEFYTADNYYLPTYTATSPVFSYLTNGFTQFYGNDPQGRINQYVDAYQITMNGAGGGNVGQGASVSFILDNKAIQNVPGFVNLFIRTVPDGSISFILQTTTGYSYIAVAGAGGAGGGSAGTVLTTGFQGGHLGGPSHEINGIGLSFGGGGGGGRSYANMSASVLKEGPGLPDGSRMTTDAAFVTSLVKTGGLINGFQGGDGYYGGGSGTIGGGGGGSYVSAYCSNVASSVLPVSYNTFGTNVLFRSPIMTVQTLRLDTHKRPSYNIYMWLTTYNILRINGGRGALLFQV